MRQFYKILGIMYVVGLFFSNSAIANIVSIDFDSLEGMVDIPGSLVPTESRLSNYYLDTVGVTFSSSAGYVAVVDHSPYGPTVSMPNVIGGVLSNNTLSYDDPIEIEFFDPTNPSNPTVTNYVSIRGDQVPLSGATATMEIFNLSGDLIGSVTADDSVEGLLLEFSTSIPDIHSIILTQNSDNGVYDGTIGFDNFTFNAVPIPGAVWLFGSGLAGLVGIRIKRKK